MNPVVEIAGAVGVVLLGAMAWILRSEYPDWGRRVAAFLLRRAALSVPAPARGVRSEEWTAELEFIWNERDCTGLVFAASLALRYVVIENLKAAWSTDVALFTVGLYGVLFAPHPIVIPMGITMCLANGLAELHSERRALRAGLPIRRLRRWDLVIPTILWVTGISAMLWAGITTGAVIPFICSAILLFRIARTFLRARWGANASGA